MNRAQRVDRLLDVYGLVTEALFVATERRASTKTIDYLNKALDSVCAALDLVTEPTVDTYRQDTHRPRHNALGQFTR